MTCKKIKVADITIANDEPFVLFGGLNVLESRDIALQVAEEFKSIAELLQIPYVFKASFDKANRSALDSYRGTWSGRRLRNIG